MLVLPVSRAPPSCASWRPSVLPVPQCRNPWPLLFLVPRWFQPPVLRCPGWPDPVGACLLPWASPRPLATGLPFALSFPGVLVVEWGVGGLWGADDPCPWVGWSGATGGGFRGCRGGEALDRVPDEGLPCRLRHSGLRGGLLGVGRGAGADPLEGVDHVHPGTLFRSPGSLHQAVELPQGGMRPPGQVGGGHGGGGFRARGPQPAVAGAPGGGCLSAARGTGSAVLFLLAGGRGNGTAMAPVVAHGEAGAAIAGPRGEGHVSAVRGTESAVPFMGGGGGGHGTAVACVVALGRAGTA